jgi:hypothetical protein
VCTVEFPYSPSQFVAPKLTIPVTDRSEVSAFVKMPAETYSFKLTFVSNNDVYIIDYRTLIVDQKTGQSQPKALRIKKDPLKSGWTPDSPLLSPDGNLVAYFLRANVKTQAAYVQPVSEDAEPIEVASQGSDPHFWQDSTGKLYLIYSDLFLTVRNSLPTLTGYSTFRQQIDPATGALIGGRTVAVDKPLNGGMSRNGRYICTGYQDGAIYDRTESKLYRVDYSESDGSMQICNPSLSPDSVNQDWMMFLNFEGPQGLLYASAVNPLPASVTVHDYLIIADKTNTVQWYIKCPSDYFEWQCPEWTNEFDYVVALAKVSGDDQSPYDCLLIRRSDNAMCNLTNGDFKLDATATPSFWIDR